tara:strand:- start:63 stop:572 length:510 start_codon:yes stop_codon:yes gene_type:complete
MARNFTLNFPSTALGPALSTTGPTYVNHGTTPFSRIGLAFDDSSDENAATGMFAMPSEYTGSGTLKCDIAYYTASATSGDVAFLCAIEALTDGDSVDMEAAQNADLTGTAATKTVPGTAGHPDVLTFTLTAKDSVAAGDITRLFIIRDVSEDGVSGDVYVASVTLYEET